MYRRTDQKRWLVKCSRCNKWQQVDFFKSIITRKKLGGERRFAFACRRCRKVLNRRKGEWVARRPSRSTSGYYVPQSIAPFISAKYLKDEYKKAKRTPNGMRKFFNYNLGRPFESGDIRLTREMVLNKVVAGTPEQGSIAIGADQGDVLHVEVRKMTDKSRIIWLGTLSSIPELVEMIRFYSRTNPTTCVLDALPNHNEALRYANTMDNLYLCHYDYRSSIDYETLVSKIEDKRVNVHRTQLLDQTAHTWQTGEVVIEHYGHNMKEIEDFATQMSNMKRGPCVKRTIRR